MSTSPLATHWNGGMRFLLNRDSMVFVPERPTMNSQVGR
jgi:hypothetical protein